MARNLKTLKTVIRSVRNTRKITQTMQLLASAKLANLQKNLKQVIQYSEGIANVAAKIDQRVYESHPLIQNKASKKNLLLIVSSDRGLCGSFPSQINAQARKYIQQAEASGLSVDILAVGNRALKITKSTNVTVSGLYPALKKNLDQTIVHSLAQTVLEGFRQGVYNQVDCIHMHKISSLAQTPITAQLLPLAFNLGEETVQEPLLEPSTVIVLDSLFNKFVQARIARAILESAACEQNARMQAMKNATDAATDIIDSLTLEYNKTRQAAITREIAQIVSGTLAIQS